jgi:hypothetical protein
MISRLTITADALVLGDRALEADYEREHFGAQLVGEVARAITPREELLGEGAG